MKTIRLVLLFIISLNLFLTIAAEDKEKTTLTKQDEHYLINLARQTLCWYLKDKSTPVPDEKSLSENVKQKLGCFVTLNHKQKGLRGCIGIFERQEPLYKNVISRAIAAATLDTRFAFDPVTYGQLKDINIEISVLTAPQDLPFSSPEDLKSKLRPMIDGVIIMTKYGSSTYLPQVWEHFDKNKDDFLSHLCQKHGAPSDIWKKDFKNVKVQTYQALVFHEEDSNRKVIGSKGATVGKKGATVLGTVLPSEKTTTKKAAPLKKGAKLKPGTIVTWESDIIEK